MARVENKRITSSKPTVTEYKGNRVLNINPEGRTNISFGLGKAMLIMENLPAIAAFLKSDGANCQLSDEARVRLEQVAAEWLPKQGE